MPEAPERDLLDTPDAGPAAVRGGVLRTVGYGAGVLVTVASAAVLFRHLGVDDAGRYVLVLSIVTLATGLTDAGLSSIGVRELAVRVGGDRERLMRNLTGTRIALTLAGIAVACAYAAVTGLGAGLVGGTAIVGVGALVQSLQSTYATPLIAGLRLGWVTALEFLRQVLVAVTIVALALADAGLVPFLAVNLLAGAVVLALTLVVVRGQTPLRPSFDRAAVLALVRQTLPFALATAIGVIYFRLAILVVDLVSSERETGWFAASFRIVEVLVVVPQLLLTAALPIFSRAARDDAERLRYGLALVAESSFTLGVAVALGLAIGAPVAIDVVAGSGFGGAVPVLRLHAVALLFSFVAAPWGYALLSQRLHREVLWFNLAALAALGVALAVLVPLDGAQGAAVATIAGEAALAVSGWFLVRRSGLHVRFGRAPRVALSALVALIPAFLLPALPAAILAELLFIGGLLLLRALPAELLEALPVPRKPPEAT